VALKLHGARVVPTEIYRTAIHLPPEARADDLTRPRGS